LVGLAVVNDEFQSDAASGRVHLAFPEVEWH
jgi:hypothetical protein